MSVHFLAYPFRVEGPPVFTFARMPLPFFYAVRLFFGSFVDTVAMPPSPCYILRVPLLLLCFGVLIFYENIIISLVAGAHAALVFFLKYLLFLAITLWRALQMPVQDSDFPRTIAVCLLHFLPHLTSGRFCGQESSSRLPRSPVTLPVLGCFEVPPLYSLLVENDRSHSLFTSPALL